MTRRFGPIAHAVATPSDALPRRHQALTVNRARLFILPAVLAIALIAAGCSNSPKASSTASSLISHGLTAESSGNTQQAVHDFRSAATRDHSDAVPYYDLGVLYQRVLHDSAQAATAYKHALSIRPKYTAALFNLAMLDTLNQPQSAMNLYNELLLQNPKNAQASFNLGLLLINQNQPTPGHTLLKKAIALDPALAKQLPAGITP
jgi:Flp pilus assembly protein TadD